MLDTINEALDKLEERQREEQQRELALYRVPETAHDYLREVYQDPRLPTHLRMRAAIEALPFERPKLAVTGIIGGGDIAAMLDERLKRIAEAKPINGSPAPVTNPARAPAIPDRRFRRL
jgi:hypothetical protein